MNKVQVRNAIISDIPLLLEILYDLDRPRPKDDNELDVFEKKIKQYLSEDDKTILLAEYNNKVVAMISIIFLSRLNRQLFEMYIPELIVGKKYRKKGIGKLLIESCIELAKKKKCYRMRLESGNNRKEAHEFYKKLGFDQSALTFTKSIK